MGSVTQRMPPVCSGARGVFGCICISAKERCFSASLLSNILSVWGQFKAEMISLLKILAEQIYFSFCSAKQNGMWVKEWLFPQHMCSHFMDRRTVFGTQKSYCCCREVPAWCPISSILNFSRGGSGLELCCSGSACAAAVVWAFCLCHGIRTSGGEGFWEY